MHTVVTKPVRRLEIVIGRMLGFSCIASLVLGLMSVIGFMAGSFAGSGGSEVASDMSSPRLRPAVLH